MKACGRHKGAFSKMITKALAIADDLNISRLKRQIQEATQIQETEHNTSAFTKEVQWLWYSEVHKYNKSVSVGSGGEGRSKEQLTF